MSEKPVPPRRDSFASFVQMRTRWGDNDSYGHVNNVVYYSFFDTAVNQHLIENEVLDIRTSPVIGLVLESQCRFFSSISFPDQITVGLRIAHLGNSSVSYQIGVFRNDDDTAAALGRFVHVYVERETGLPIRIPDSVRAVLEPLLISNLPANASEKKF